MKNNRYRSTLLAAAIGISSSVMVYGFQAKTGDPAPKFSVTSMSGKQIFFQDMQTGGPVFIYFIRDGDEVSQQMTLYVNKIIRAYGETRSTWYGLINAREDRARSYQAEVDPAFRLERDETNVATKAFGVSSAPSVMEYSSKGKLLHSWKGYSADKLKDINAAFAKSNHRPVQVVDFSDVPTTARYGSDYNTATGVRG